MLGIDNRVIRVYNRVIMAYKEYLISKQKRDENLIAYAQEHPKMSQRALAEVFKISEARVWVILRKHDKKGE